MLLTLISGQKAIVGNYRTVSRALNAASRMLAKHDGEIFVHRCAGPDLVNGSNIVGCVFSKDGAVKTHEL